MRERRPTIKRRFYDCNNDTLSNRCFAKYAIDSICVDSTQRTTSHDFQLTALIVVDEFGAGCPVAFCLNNRIDSVGSSRFVLFLKEKLSLISTKDFQLECRQKLEKKS